MIILPLDSKNLNGKDYIVLKKAQKEIKCLEKDYKHLEEEHEHLEEDYKHLEEERERLEEENKRLKKEAPPGNLWVKSSRNPPKELILIKVRVRHSILYF